MSAAGPRSQFLRDVLLILLAGAPIVALGGLACFHGAFPQTQDAIDYAQIARNVREGRGLVSDIALPVSIAFPFGRTLPQPILYRPPLPSIALVPFVAAFGASDAALIAGTVTFALLAAIAAYFLGRRVGGAARGRAVGLAAAAIVLVNTGIGEEIGKASAEPVAMLLVTSLFLALLADRPLLAGGLFGAILTAKLHIVAILPVVFVPPLLRSGRWRRALALFAAGVALVLSPWIARNLVVTGRPLFDLHAYTETQRAGSFAPGAAYAPHRRTEIVSSSRFIASQPSRLLGYSSELLSSTAKGLPSYLGPGVVALLLFSLIVRPRSPSAGAAHFLPHAAFASMTFGLCLIVLGPRLFLVLVPLVAVSGANSLLEWAGRGRTERATAGSGGRGAGATSRGGALRIAVAILFVGALAAPQALRLVGAARRAARGDFGRFVPPQTENLRAKTTAESAIASDDLSIAWYAHRRVVWLPWEEKDLRALDQSIPIEAVFLRQDDASLRKWMGDRTVDVMTTFVANECEPAGVEADGSGRLYLRRRGARPPEVAPDR